MGRGAFYLQGFEAAALRKLERSLASAFEKHDPRHTPRTVNPVDHFGG